MGSLHRLFVRETGSLHRLFVRELQVCVAVAPAAYAVPELPVLTLISLGDADATDCVGPHADHGGSSRGGGGGAGGGGCSPTCSGRGGWWWRLLYLLREVWLPYLPREGLVVVAPLLRDGGPGGGGSPTCSRKGGWWWLPYSLREGRWWGLPYLLRDGGRVVVAPLLAQGGGHDYKIQSHVVVDCHAPPNVLYNTTSWCTRQG